jgi:ribosome-associated protein
VVLDVSRLIQITDWFVIGSGTSQRHVQTLAEAVEEQLELLDRKPLRIEGRQPGSWVLLDYGDLVVHLFLPETREYFDLERLWGDAPRLAWEPVASA